MVFNISMVIGGRDKLNGIMTKRFSVVELHRSMVNLGGMSVMGICAFFYM